MTDGNTDRRRSECEDYYRQLHEKCGSILEAAFQADVNGAQSNNHNFISDMEKWIVALDGRPEVAILTAGLREYQFSLLAVAQGQYRQAFMALRLFLELTLGSIYLSANELELRIWLRGRRDIDWTPLIDEGDGIFSEKFVGAFFEDLANEAAQYGAIAKRIYRECSEYVHGNMHTHDILEKFEFIKDTYLDWHNKAQNVRMLISFALCARYLMYFDKSTRESLELPILDELGHITAIRAIFGGTTEV